MNKDIYPISGKYREIFHVFNLFFHEVSLTYGRGFSREVKREALGDYFRTGDLIALEEEGLIARVKARHPEIKRNLDAQTRMIMGAAA